MSEDKLDFLDGQPAEATPEPAQPEPKAEPIADKGEPAAEPAPSAPPAEPAKEQHVAPLTALLDEREKRQTAERERDELRAWRQQQEAGQRVQVPDPRQDPEGALAYQQSVFQQQINNVRLSQSRFLAEQQFGKDAVDAAFAFFDQNPALSHQLLDHPSPFHAAVQFHKRQLAADQVGSDPEAWITKERERLRAEILAEMPQVPAQPKPRLPGSLAGAPAAGSPGEPVPKGTAFDAAFG